MRGSACWGVLWSVRENPSENPGNERGENRGGGGGGGSNQVEACAPATAVEGANVRSKNGRDVHVASIRIACVPTSSMVVMRRSRASSRLCSHNRLPRFPPPIPSDNPMEKNEVKAKFDMHAPHPTVSFLECNWVDVSRRFLPNVKTAHSGGGVFSTLAEKREPSRVHVDTT